MTTSDEIRAPDQPVDKYERIEGWRITEHELGPHPEVESCEEPPVCLHVFRLVSDRGRSDG